MKDYEKVIELLASSRPIGTGTIIYKGRAYHIDYNYNPPKIKEIQWQTNKI